MSISEAIAGNLFFCESLRGEGMLRLFEELSRLGIKCKYPTGQGGQLAEPVTYYRDNPSRKRYFIWTEEQRGLVSVDRQSGTVFMRAGLVGIEKEVVVERVISTMVSIMDHLSGVFDFSFGWLDLEGDVPPKIDAIIETRALSWLFWVSYFGGPYVKRFGKEFFLRAPLGKAQELSNGTIKYMIRPDVHSPLTPEQEQVVLEYFSRVQEVKMYSIEQFGFR